MSESEIEELQRIRAGWVTKRNAYLQAQMLGIGSIKENEEGVTTADKYIADLDKRIANIQSSMFYESSLTRNNRSNLLSRASLISHSHAQMARMNLPLILLIIALIIFVIAIFVIKFIS